MPSSGVPLNEHIHASKTNSYTHLFIRGLCFERPEHNGLFATARIWLERAAKEMFTPDGDGLVFGSALQYLRMYSFCRTMPF